MTGGIRAVLLDIEGTTTPIAFVHERLFSYAREHVRSVLEDAAASDSEIGQIVEGLREEYLRDRERGETLTPWPENLAASASAHVAAVTAYVNWLIDRDRKLGPLKALQGRIWARGYADGSLKGEVYPDVLAALQRWTADGIRVGIFSSGSVLAQQLLFKHSTAGDLTHFLSWYFDTVVGPKREVASYRRIAAHIGVPVDAILFLSDTPEEVAAARAAGLQSRRIDRDQDMRAFDSVSFS